MLRHSALRLALLLLLAAPTADAATGELHRSWSFQAPPGLRLVVDAADADVRLRVGDVRRIVVTVDLGIAGVTERQARTWIEHHTPRFEEIPGKLGISLEEAPRGLLGHVTSRARLTLVAPAHVLPDLTTTTGDVDVWGDFPEAAPLYLRTLSGTISWTGASRSLDARATTGRIHVRVVRPLQTFVASTSGGDVTLQGGAATARVDTSSGAVHLAGLSGSARVTTASGRVDLAWDRAGAGTSIRVRSTRGPVRIVLPETSRPSGELRTTGGEIHCDLPAASGAGTGTVRLEGEGPALDVETSDAPITLALTPPGVPARPAGA